MGSVHTVEDGGKRTAALVELSPEQRTGLDRLARQRSLAARVVERARIATTAPKPKDITDTVKTINIASL
jgi:ribosomal protein L17